MLIRSFVVAWGHSVQGHESAELDADDWIRRESRESAADGRALHRP
jgi:hypothetical protein